MNNLEKSKNQVHLTEAGYILESISRRIENAINNKMSKTDIYMLKEKVQKEVFSLCNEFSKLKEEDEDLLKDYYNDFLSNLDSGRYEK